MKSLIPYFISTALVLSFQGCGVFDVQEPQPDDPGFSTDAKILPYVQEFEVYAGFSTAHVPIAFDDLESGIAGICYRASGGGKTVAYIKLDRGYWPIMSEYQKINLVFHELRHCVLNRWHTPSDYSPLECPSSFMHDTVMGNYCLNKNFNSYIKEMFPGWGG